MAIQAATRDALRETFDRATFALNTIDYAHHEIHAGSFFTAGTALDLSAGGTVQLKITTPDSTRWAHLVGLVSVESESTVSWYENPTSPGAGAALPAYNHNRNSSGTATCAVAGSVGTFSGTVGTTLARYNMGSGRGVGGDVREINEWVLKQNEDYLLEVVNGSSGPSLTTLVLAWYEHTNKES